MTDLITTDLSPVPSRKSPGAFSDDMDTFLGKLPEWTDEANDLAAGCNTNALASAGSAEEALISASDAADSASDAADSASDAEESALTALNAPGTSATSTTSLTIDSISQSLTLVQTGKVFSIGQYVNITNTSAPENAMFGKITSFNGGTGEMTVSVSGIDGSGTYSDWTISLAQSLLQSATTEEMEEATETELRSMSPADILASILKNTPNFIIKENRTSNTILGTNDNGKLINVTSGTFTQTLTSAVTLGYGWFCYIMNSGTGIITIDPDDLETIGLCSNAVLNPGNFWIIICDGTNFLLVRLCGENKQIYTSGVSSFIVPAGVYKINYEVWGAGGGYSSMLSLPGGGGSYCAGALDVTPGQSITATVGSAGTSNTSGGSSTFGSITAGGGTYNGSASVSTGGDINIPGGIGAAYRQVDGSTQSYIAGSSPRGGQGAVRHSAATKINAGSPGGGGGEGTTAASGMIKIGWV